MGSDIKQKFSNPHSLKDAQLNEVVNLFKVTLKQFEVEVNELVKIANTYHFGYHCAKKKTNT